MSKSGFIIPSIVLGAALIVASYVAANQIRLAKEASQVIKVVGSAKKPLTSDFGKLSASISGSGSTQALALQSVNKQRVPLLQFLGSKGITEAQVEFSPPSDNHLYEYDKNGRFTGTVIRYGFTQTFKIENEDVQKLKELSLSLVQLIDQGVSVKVNSPQYFYTKLAALKVEVQALAAADAKARAKKIAAATETTLGPIRSARMGVLQITPRNSNTVSDYGMNDTSSIEKEITAVVSAEFQVK